MMAHHEQIQILRIERLKARQYLIMADDGQSFTIHEDLLVRFGLSKGKLLSREQIEQLLSENSAHAAYRLALRFIGIRQRSAREVRKKLTEKQYTTAIIDQVIAKLTGQGFLNDRAYAENVSEQRMLVQKKGRRWVANELRQKGVGNALIQEALNKIDAESEYRAALLLAEKKWRMSSGDNRKKAEKTAGFLLRRGYSGSIVARALREIRGSMSENDDDGLTEEAFTDMFPED
ncbi:MAG TPA: RecX family transcriptional regulator [Bacilli bacterium]